MHLEVHSANANAADDYENTTTRRESLSTYFNCDLCGKYMISENVLGNHIEFYSDTLQREPFRHVLTVMGVVNYMNYDNVLG